jgi:hypothetical protein
MAAFFVLSDLQALVLNILKTVQTSRLPFASSRYFRRDNDF